MGRFITGDIEYKFWFGCQPSSDILEFGKETTDTISVVVRYDELSDIQDKVDGYKKAFAESFNMSYSEFMQKLDEKGYISSGEDAETQTTKWNAMLREASLICLGITILEELKKKKSDLYLEAEC